jgi:polyisoprenoid-binding protein YceI
MSATNAAFRFLLGICVLTILILPAHTAWGAPQALPLDPQASSLVFVGQATLHNFHGEARDFTGVAILDPDAIPPIQKATLHFKTAALTTFQNQRDQKMREWLKVTVHPEATFSLENVTLVGGEIQTANVQQPARFTVEGTLTLNGVTQPIDGSASGWRERNRLVVSGDAIVDTLKFELPQVREGFLNVGTKVKTTYRFSFVLPPAYTLK